MKLLFCVSPSSEYKTWGIGSHNESIEGGWHKTANVLATGTTGIEESLFNLIGRYSYWSTNWDWSTFKDRYGTG